MPKQRTTIYIEALDLSVGVRTRYALNHWLLHNDRCCEAWNTPPNQRWAAFPLERLRELFQGFDATQVRALSRLYNVGPSTVAYLELFERRLRESDPIFPS